MNDVDDPMIQAVRADQKAGRAAASPENETVQDVWEALHHHVMFLLNLVKDSVQTRLALFELEQQEWRDVLAQKLLAGVLLGLTFFLLMISLNIAVVVYFWESYRIQAAFAVSLILFFTVCGLGYYFVCVGRHFIPFEETRKQLKKDRANL
jgi:uncharacterized membrane protein YqjE